MFGKAFNSPLGRISVICAGGAVTEVHFEDCGGLVSCPEAELAEKQLGEYFAGKRKSFSLPLKPEGTAFRKAVWNALAKIPYGETRSYGDIARAVGKPGGARAVGQANGDNPIPIIIPCHRVINADGSTGGYSGGGGEKVKSFLLELEKASPGEEIK